MERELAEIFEEVVDLAQDQREFMLLRRCDGKPELRKRLEELLARDRRLRGKVSSNKVGPVIVDKNRIDEIQSDQTARFHRRAEPEISKDLERQIAELVDRERQHCGDTLRVGSQIGSYRITRRLDEGGMGVVYVAEHEELPTRVVVKVLRAELARNPDIVKRFRAEAHAAAIIEHPGIVNVHDVGCLENGRLYILMEYLEGETLQHRLQQVGALPTGTAVVLARQVARALAAAHENGIVHRDLKPSNVFLVRDPEVTGGERVKLLDFGIAKLMEENSGLQTMTGAQMGTPPYMPPEQFLDAADVDHRADLYSLGIILFEMLCGRTPFRRRSFGQYMRAHFDEPPPPVTRFNPCVPDALAQLIQRLLEKDREHRHDSARQLLSALDRVTGEDSASSMEPYEVEVCTRQFADGGDSPDPAGAVSSAADSQRPLDDRAGLDSAEARLVARAATRSAAQSEIPPLTRVEPEAGSRRHRLRRRLVRWSLAIAAIATVVAVVALLPTNRLSSRERAPDLSVDLDTIEAIRLVRGPTAAEVLYQALEKRPPLSIEAAHTLRDLGLPEAAPKVRAMLHRYAGRGRVELAACLVAMGDDDAVSILERSLGDELHVRLIAAAALAESGNGGNAGSVLREVFERPGLRGRDSWRLAARGLRALGDESARVALRKELASSQPDRAVLAARVLARENDEVALGALQRMLNDPGFSHRGHAALILAGLNQDSALRFVKDGLGSPDPHQRQLAIAVAGRMARRGGAEYARDIQEATSDNNRKVRITARVALLELSQSR